MAGVDTDSGTGSGGRRTPNSEINMVPMIDLMMVTIAFLLITAVWTNMARLESSAQVPGPASPCESDDCKPEPRLHVEARDESTFRLVWKQGSTVLDTREVRRHKDVHDEGKTKVIRYPELATAVEAEWKIRGAHRNADDKRFDQAVVHAPNEMPYSEMIAVIDAVSKTRRPLEKKEGQAFAVTFAAD